MGLLRKLAIAAVVVAVLVRTLAYYLAHFTPLNGMFPALTTERHFASFADLPALGGKVAVVTGANTGLGFSTAKALAAAGATTVLTCRSQTLCQDAAARIFSAHPAAIVQTRTLDLGALASVRGFADSLLTGEAAVDKVDMLVLNAGVMASPYTLTADGLEQQFGVNHVGHA
jgi:NAD(P)-dependent dehydrogenase (short-subunit alcohol dehydrogenase family)